MTRDEKEFVKGIALALGIIACTWGEEHIAQMTLKETGYTKEDLVKAGCEESDIKNIFGGRV